MSEFAGGSTNREHKNEPRLPGICGAPKAGDVEDLCTLSLSGKRAANTLRWFERAGRLQHPITPFLLLLASCRPFL